MAGYFDSLLTFLDHTVREGFIKPAHRQLLVHAADAGTLLELLATSDPAAVQEKWEQLPEP